MIFMPSIAPISKVEATKKLGAEVHLVDGVYDDAYLAAEKYCKEHDCIFVHPFDDEDVIAGQGSIALEILEQYPDVDTVLVPVGGGGLFAGEHLVDGRHVLAHAHAEARGGIALRVDIDAQHAIAACRDAGGEIDAGGRLAHAAFLVGNGDDFAHSDLAFLLPAING